MVIIGVTGNSGSGKSTVSTIIKNNSGAFVIDADSMAKEMMAVGEKYYEDIVKLFGEDILIQSGKNKGKIDRSKLSTIIFHDLEKRAALNKLTFKYVGEKTKQLLLENKDKDFVVLDFPLLFEGGYNKLCNYVVGVVSENQTKVSRIVERDKITRDEGYIRISSQIDDKDIIENSDYVIFNVADLEYVDLVKAVLSMMRQIKKKEKEKNKNK